MRCISRSALVPYGAQDMFQLVDDVAAYATFLPWCSRSEELSRSEDVVEATLEMRKGAMRKAFTTRNTKKLNESISLELLDGQFAAVSPLIQMASNSPPLASNGPITPTANLLVSA